MEKQDIRWPSEWMTTSEAAEYLRLSKYEVRNLSSNGVIPYYKLGRRNRYLLSELHQLLLTTKGGSHDQGSQ
jgi:excisionase family DNA binding protein